MATFAEHKKILKFIETFKPQVMVVLQMKVFRLGKNVKEVLILINVVDVVKVELEV